ncbi:unnamed protein product [Prunus armeniaca]|uniref:Uncharacterized protein n=1 Tax=Prunus armeniaca TaxID=36596 RepID=A0A6J5VMX2_PRUAR|nr:unnamed protein product [Prunus armeniaca]
MAASIQQFQSLTRQLLTYCISSQAFGISFQSLRRQLPSFRHQLSKLTAATPKKRHQLPSLRQLLKLQRHLPTLALPNGTPQVTLLQRLFSRPCRTTLFTYDAKATCWHLMKNKQNQLPSFRHQLPKFTLAAPKFSASASKAYSGSS